MTLALLLLLTVVVVFAGIVVFGAPYVPSKKRQVEVALDLLALKPGQRLFDLGAGDGRVAISAAKRGLKVTAYELNPILAAIAWFRARRYGKLVSVKLSDYWRADLNEADGVFIFSAELYMKRLDRKLSKVTREIRLASFAFPLSGRRPWKQAEGIYLYKIRPLAKKASNR